MMGLRRGKGEGRGSQFATVDTHSCRLYIKHMLRNFLFSRDVINILKCKIAKPLSFQFTLVIERLKEAHNSFRTVF